MRQRSINVRGSTHGAPIPSACRLGPVLVTSAVSGRDPATDKLPADADSQVRFAFENLKRILAEGGMEPGDVAKITCFVADDGIRDVINKYWLEWYPDAAHRPARHTIVLPPRGGAMIQLEALAVSKEL